MESSSGADCYIVVNVKNPVCRNTLAALIQIVFKDDP